MESAKLDLKNDTKNRRIRLQRACDICRRKKIRCDGAQMPDRCSNCIALGFECSYVEPAKKRGPPRGYVESMEVRIEKMERLLRTLVPEADLARHLSDTSALTRRDPPVDEDERAQLSLIENLQGLSLTSDHDSRFFGRSSGAMLLQTALNVKLDSEPQNARRHAEFWASRPSPESAPPPQYDFPPPDLSASLMDLYFTHTNLFIPLLHRPTFARDLANRLHLTNNGFAATFLLVCAIGSRFSSDPRVLLDGTDKLHSSGWRWFRQLQPMRDPLGPPPCLYDLQVSALSVIFLHFTSAPQSCWTLVAIGIRMAQDVGAHRRKESTHHWTAEDELGKRAFWVLIFLDRMLSADCGRPTAIQDEDFDLDYPIDCDDEYWEAPDQAQAFRQPPGKPSRISAFILYLRLFQVLSFALRTIYSINKSRVLLGLSKSTNVDWDHRIIVELDSALNKWLAEVPDHLRWNPMHEHADFFEQSVALHCSYHHLQIMIHRPFILKTGAATSSSSGICLNAARSCSHIVDIHRQRTGDKPLFLTQMAVFTAGIILLLNIWGGKRPGSDLSADSDGNMAEVQRCMQVLRVCEIQWQSAGRMLDILRELASAGELPPAAAAKPMNERDRGAEKPHPATATPFGRGHIPTTSPPSRDDVDDGETSAGEPLPIVESQQSPLSTVTSPITEERLTARNRQHTSGIPGIVTQLLPHLQYHSQAYRSNAALSASPLHRQQQDRFTMPMQVPAYAAPDTPDTPLSASSIYSQRVDPYDEGFAFSHPPGPPSAHSHEGFLHHHIEESLSRNHSRQHPHRQDPLLSSQPLSQGHEQLEQPNPLLLSMGTSIHRHDQRLDFPYSRQLHPSTNVGHGYNYSYFGDQAGPAPDIDPIHSRHVHLSSSDNMGNRSSVPAGPASSSFPMSEAFYDQLMESFSAPHHRYTEPRGEMDSYSNSDPRKRENIMDQDAIAMWPVAPTGIELDGWGQYLETMNEVTQGRMHAGG